METKEKLKKIESQKLSDKAEAELKTMANEDFKGFCILVRQAGYGEGYKQGYKKGFWIGIGSIAAVILIVNGIIAIVK